MNSKIMQFLMNLSFVRESILKRSSNRDKALIQVIALFVPISALIAGFAFFYAVNFVTQSTLLALVAGLLLCFAVFAHDRTILDTYSNSKIIGRIIFSIAMALVIAIPYKVELAGESLKLKVEQEVEDFNNGIEKELIDAKQLIYDREEELRQHIEETTKKWKTDGQQPTAEARKVLKGFMSNKDTRIKSLEANFSSKKIEADTSNPALAGYYLTNMFNTNSPSEIFINLFIFMLLLSLEAMPAFVRLILNEGDYVRIKEHLEKIGRKADDKIREIDERILHMENLSDFSALLDERNFWEMLKWDAQNGFVDSQILAVYFKKMDTPTPSVPPENPSPKQNSEATTPEEAEEGFPIHNYKK